MARITQEQREFIVLFLTENPNATHVRLDRTRTAVVRRFLTPAGPSRYQLFRVAVYEGNMIASVPVGLVND